MMLLASALFDFFLAHFFRTSSLLMSMVLLMTLCDLGCSDVDQGAMDGCRITVRARKWREDLFITSAHKYRVDSLIATASTRDDRSFSVLDYSANIVQGRTVSLATPKPMQNAFSDIQVESVLRTERGDVVVVGSIGTSRSDILRPQVVLVLDPHLDHLNATINYGLGHIERQTLMAVGGKTIAVVSAGAAKMSKRTYLSEIDVSGESKHFCVASNTSNVKGAPLNNRLFALVGNIGGGEEKDGLFLAIVNSNFEIERQRRLRGESVIRLLSVSATREGGLLVLGRIDVTDGNRGPVVAIKMTGELELAAEYEIGKTTGFEAVSVFEVKDDVYLLAETANDGSQVAFYELDTNGNVTLQGCLHGNGPYSLVGTVGDEGNDNVVMVNEGARPNVGIGIVDWLASALRIRTGACLGIYKLEPVCIKNRSCKNSGRRDTVEATRRPVNRVEDNGMIHLIERDDMHGTVYDGFRITDAMIQKVNGNKRK